MTKVIHVHLIFEKKNYYFGSISAIFDTLTEEEIGITKNSLLHAGMTDGSCKNDQTGYDHPVASDTERTVRNELESITFVVPLVCNQKCNTFCNTFFVLHFLYRWFLWVGLFGGVFKWL